MVQRGVLPLSIHGTPTRSNPSRDHVSLDTAKNLKRILPITVRENYCCYGALTLTLTDRTLSLRTANVC